MRKRLVSFILAFALVIGMCACGQKNEIITDAPTWQEQYDLGIRYLSEGNYEEAIIAFTAAIEIDPKQPDAYRKAAEAYEGLGDVDSAIAILQQGIEVTGDQALRDLLDENSTPLEDAQTSLEGVQLTLSLSDPNLRASYPINKPENRDDAMEYCWFVCFNDGINFYEVGTSYFKRAGEEPKNATLHEMQSNLWVQKSESNGFTWVVEAELKIDGTDLSWTFTIPEEYNFDLENMEITGTMIEEAQPY